MMTTPLPKGKLDAMTTLTAVSAADGGGVVNGPEGEILDWDAIDWRAIEENVRRLRQRIFTASRAGDCKKVRNLQKLMLRSRANTLVSVRRVTQVNAGRKTPGIDGQVALFPEVRAELTEWIQRESGLWKAQPVKRVYIVRRAALCCIPNAVGINSEGGFWA